LRESPYALLCATVGTYLPPPASTSTGSESEKPKVQWWDILHPNSIQVLSKNRASQFPMFKGGQILLSLRELHVIIVMDVEKRSVVWAARAPWRAQHDAQFLDNGHILLFDNLGCSSGSRAIEYDPKTLALPWWYAGENRAPFLCKERGMCQRLPN